LARTEVASRWANLTCGNKRGDTGYSRHSPPIKRKFNIRVPPQTQRLCVILFLDARSISSKDARMSLWDPVYKLVKQIPRGRVLSYGAVAKALRLKGGARSAGRAMSATPQGKGIPWHRVLNAAGKIVIREPYAGLQRKLLESEGIEVVENRVKMKTYLWTPPHRTHKSTKEKPSAKRSNKRRSK
jgi:methylated-DNA-protein-cysteine methyltransferase-like protein